MKRPLHPRERVIRRLLATSTVAAGAAVVVDRVDPGTILAEILLLVAIVAASTVVVLAVDLWAKAEKHPEDGSSREGDGDEHR